MYDTQKNIAIAFGYKEPLLDNKSKKLFVDNNSVNECTMCGTVRKTGYIDKKKQLFGDKTNSFYSFANPQSEFLCSYCYYNYKSYKKVQQKANVDELFIKEIEKMQDNKDNFQKIQLAYEKLCLDLQTKYFDENNKCILEKPQEKKIDIIVNMQKNQKNKDNIQLAKDLIPYIFSYHDIRNFAKRLGFEDMAKIYNNINDIGDVVIDSQNNVIPIDCKSTSKDNGLYKIFKNPPVPPFIVLLKDTKGSTFVDNAHTAKTTIDKNTIIVNYGTKSYIVPVKKVFECLKTSEEILKRHRKNKTKKQEAVVISDDVLFNRANSTLYSNYFTSKLRRNGLFMDEYIKFVNTYDKGVRFAAKTMLETYRTEEKIQIKQKGETK